MKPSCNSQSLALASFWGEKLEINQYIRLMDKIRLIDGFCPSTSRSGVDSAMVSTLHGGFLCGTDGQTKNPAKSAKFKAASNRRLTCRKKKTQTVGPQTRKLWWGSSLYIYDIMIYIYIIIIYNLPNYIVIPYNLPNYLYTPGTCLSSTWGCQPSKKKAQTPFKTFCWVRRSRTSPSRIWGCFIA